MKVTFKPEPRAEHSYKGRLTILEGRELQELMSHFFRLTKCLEPKLKKATPEGKVVACALMAYQKAHRTVLTDQQLKELVYADARKADLFYRFSMHMLSRPPKAQKTRKKR